MYEPTPEHARETPETEARPRSLTIKLPRWDTQTAVLGLIALVTVLQTVQLYGLKAATQNTSLKAASSSVSKPASVGGSGGALPQMVGGC